jgi:peptidoglycan hydrolase CwlO-like protein
MNEKVLIIISAIVLIVLSLVGGACFTRLYYSGQLAELAEYRQLYRDAEQRAGDAETRLRGVQEQIDGAIERATNAATGVTGETAKVRANLAALQDIINSFRNTSGWISGAKPDTSTLDK